MKSKFLCGCELRNVPTGYFRHTSPHLLLLIFFSFHIIHIFHIHFLEYAILSVRPRPLLVISVTKNTDPSFSNALLYWMFRDQ